MILLRRKIFAIQSIREAIYILIFWFGLNVFNKVKRKSKWTIAEQTSTRLAPLTPLPTSITSLARKQLWGYVTNPERKQLIWDLKVTKVELLAPMHNVHILAYNEGVYSES